MTDASAERSRLLPRFSLRTILFVIALVACGITIWQLWRELAPLRAEVRQMRAQLGFLSVDDESRPYAIQIHEWDDEIWRWRIYLPPSGKYKLYQAGGQLPANGGTPDQAWLQTILSSPNLRRSALHSAALQGQFTLEARLSPDGTGWLLRTAPGGGGSTYRFKDNWLADEIVRTSTVHSNVRTRQQREFKPGEPILLFYVAKPEITTTPAQPGRVQQQHYDLPKESAEGIVLWLGQ